MSKRALSIFMVVVLLISLLVGCGEKEWSDNQGKETFVSIATGGTGGAYYPLGGAMAKIFNENIPGVTANAQSTGASVENIGLVSKGETEIAFVQNDVT